MTRNDQMRVEEVAGGYGLDGGAKNGIMSGQNGNSMFAFAGLD